MGKTVKDFLRENSITAKLVMSSKEKEEGKSKVTEVFIDPDGFITTDEDSAMSYNCGDTIEMSNLIDYGETLANCLNNVHAVFYAPNGCNMEGWISQEELGEPLDETHFLRELI